MAILVSEVTIGPGGITSRAWEVPGPLEPGEGWKEIDANSPPPVPAGALPEPPAFLRSGIGRKT